MRCFLLVIVFFLPGAVQQASAATSQAVHGRMTYANGNPSCRIWIVGTNRMLGVRESGREVPQMPEKLRKLMTWDREIYANFTVVPLTPYKKGLMQIVQVKTARELVVVEQGKVIKRLSVL